MTDSQSRWRDHGAVTVISGVQVWACLRTSRFTPLQRHGCMAGMIITCDPPLTPWLPCLPRRTKLREQPCPLSQVFCEFLHTYTRIINIEPRSAMQSLEALLTALQWECGLAELVCILSCNVDEASASQILLWMPRLSDFKGVACGPGFFATGLR